MADNERPMTTDTPKKRKVTGRQREKAKKLRVSNHVTGENCNCARFRCFEAISPDERQSIIEDFNTLYDSKNGQDAYLATLISVGEIHRRRPRQNDDERHKPKSMSLSYVVKLQREGSCQSVNVCAKAFCSIFGITKHRVETIRKAMFSTGHPPQDGRGKHANRPHKFTEATKQLVRDHISSFRGRHSHYALGETRKLYLPEDLNISIMHQLFKKIHPEAKVSYESYRNLFNTEYNIGFGYPRKDTCSVCDEFIANLSHLDAQLAQDDCSPEVESRKAQLLMEHELHKRKASTFYDRKSAAKDRAKSSEEFEGICFDFAKNLYLPNKTTNDVYYRRQLGFYTFDIHVLSTDEVFLYTYDETVARKGADDVCSMLADFISSHLSDRVTDVSFFCDGCSGQNKNYTLLRFMYSLVHHLKRLKSIKILFPIRGHSYMECDRDMGVVNCKRDAETPDDWRRELEGARSKPSAFHVINADKSMFFSYTDFLAPRFKASNPVKTRPVREFQVLDTRPDIFLYRDAWNGCFSSAVVKREASRRKKEPEQIEMKQSYTGPLPISMAKFKDLQVLKKFCSPLNHEFFNRLPYLGHASTSAEGQDSDASEAGQSDIDD